MIQFRNLALARGAKRLFEGASLQIHPGWRVGLTGANGSGKSSLFALLRGELHAEQGDCEVPERWRIASVDQETPALEDAAIEFVIDGDQPLRALERDLAAAESSHDGAHLGAHLGDLHARMHDIDGYAARARAAALLAGLGFADADLERPVASFSGGWRMRLNLARALISRAELMLLDEPTNHLDLDAVVWLEKWLAGYRGTVILVSHDRDFLDACATHVLYIGGGKLALHTGNYSAFEERRAAQLAAQQAMHEKQVREIEHLESFIVRFRAKATKARQAQSRLKALDRMERISAAHVDAPFDFEFLAPGRAPDPLLILSEISAGYGATNVLEDVRLDLRAGARIGLLGPNGAGKSTLVKLLAGELAPTSGARVEGKGLAIGYFAQHQLEQLRADESPLAHLAREHRGTREQELRNFLGGFDFRGKTADSPVGPFSGGERSRLALALLLRRRPNLLLLDEPTNHLDLEMRHALMRALAGYEGSLVLVSHDRALLRTVCDSFLLVADGRAAKFDGDLDDYLAWLDARREARTARKPARNDGDRQDKLARRRPLVKEIAAIEAQLAAWQEERHRLDAQLADPELYASPDLQKLRGLMRRQHALARLIEQSEARWLVAHTELEAIEEQPDANAHRVPGR
ncbi:MAG: ATP-binding cassette domain-containing protein [Betaproteobacteria bacterium]|nr:ATP-binding cassette domain-containing protein [Betaproteobacteria bacterium]